MKKTLLILIALISICGITMAQPATMTKGDDTLCDNTRLSVEIITLSGTHFSHPQHPTNGIICPFVERFTTVQPYAWYQWESSFFDPTNGDDIRAEVYFPGYIKVTVGDGYGHTGTDSIWFNVRSIVVEPLGDFIMEIDDDLHANFHAVVTENHHSLRLMRGYELGVYHYNDSQVFFLTPGEEWIYTDTNVSYSEDSLWLYEIRTLDICGYETSNRIVPGLLLDVHKEEQEEWYLSIKSLLQSDYGFGSSYLYSIYTLDRDGNRHPVTDDNGDPIILNSYDISWPISPDMVSHPFYQCGVAQPVEDGNYQLLSLSNKVVNPYYPYYPYPYEALHIEDIEEGHTYDYCLYQYGSLPLVALLGETDCPQQEWEWECNGEHFSETGDSISIAIPDVTQRWDVTYHGCDRDVSFHVLFYSPDWDNPFAAPFVWKHNGEAVGLAAVDDEAYASGDIACHWSTGETTNHIEATEVGTYSVSISAHGCSDAYSMKLRDNVEIAVATVDLKTGRDKVTWQVNPEQAEYIDKVKVIRYDGSAYVAPYDQGYYLLYGVEDVARNYHLVAVSKEGVTCPVDSYEKGTIHASYEQDTDGYLNIRWNTPYMEAGAPTELAGFQICQYNAATEAVTVVDEVGATATDYTGDASLFAGAQVVVAAVFNNSGAENRSFSNLYTMVGVGENEKNGFKVYPNPANNVLFVETRRTTSLHAGTTYRITNLMGQTLMTGAVETRHGTSLQQINIENLPQGMYFVTIDGATRKFVVE